MSSDRMAGDDSTSFPATLREAAADAAFRWERERGSARLWSGDADLWTGADEGRWLGWLDAPGRMRADLGDTLRFGAAVAAERYAYVALLGMGGSSLCSEVLRETFGRLSGAPDLRVLDSTDPAQVRAFERGLDVARTLFIVASKSGTTLEPSLFERYFFARVAGRLGAATAGTRFVAVTDPDSALERRAAEVGYRAVFHGVPSIGGRFSALSPFGMVPATAMGVDVGRLLASAERMAAACAADVPASRNPGVRLGLMLGVAAQAGRDKVTLVLAPPIRSLGAWLEQLLAESTGKQGTAILPIDGEMLGPPDAYGDDRFFVSIGLHGAADEGQDAALARIEAAGHPVVRWSLADRHDIAGEFFRWEIATAVAGSLLGINPFDQPDVEASKVATRRLTAQHESRGGWPEDVPIGRGSFAGGAMLAYADEGQSARLRETAGSSGIDALVAAHCASLRAGDYFGVLAYVERSEVHEAALARLRHAVRDVRRVATMVGFGPRFLHSTGQAFKGGPNSGVFLQITGDDGDDLPVPGQASFGVVKAAQARGDAAVLAERGRRLLRLHLRGPAGPGLEALADMVAGAMRSSPQDPPAGTG